MTLYSEFDPFAAAWLRELITDNLIAPGTVDASDIRDLIPADLVGHNQVHLFAGIGVWSLALRLAGVPDDLEVWTASCPCQPFSAAGRRKGTADERHLWPAAFHLIRHCRPRVILGEQVASPDGLAWLDVVLADLEAEGYACRAVDLCAAGVGAPHIRQRLYWIATLAHAEHDGLNRETRSQAFQDGDEQGVWVPERNRSTRRLADADLTRPQGRRGVPQRADQLAPRAGGVAGGMEHAAGVGSCRGFENKTGQQSKVSREGHESTPWPGPTNGLWRDPDWLLCRDAKWRPVVAGTFPLADARAFRNRVGLLRGAGNAINVAQAQAFIQANRDVIHPDT